MLEFFRRRKDWNLLKQYFPVFALSLVYFLVRSLYFDYPMIWDSRLYYLDMIYAQATPFDLLNYSARHNSQIWILLAGLPNYFFGGDYYIYNAWIALLSTTALVCFYTIIRTLFGSTYNVIEALLITSVFAFHPSVFVNLIHVSVDAGLLIFLIWFMTALLKEKWLLATFFGSCLMFSKEPAIAYLLVVFIFCAFRQPFGLRLAWIKKHYLVFCIPYALVFIYLIYKTIVLNQIFFFGGFLQKTDWLIRVLPDSSLITYALMALVLNFNWIFTVLGMVFACSLCWINRSNKSLFYKGHAAAFAWLLLATLLVALGVRCYSNLRYLLPVFLALVICFAYVLPFVSNKFHRIGLLSIVLSALLAQNFRSVDPVSNSIFCRTSFGTHKVLAIPDFDTVCKLNEKTWHLTGDRLVYNTEFLYVPMLIEEVMKDIRPNSKTVFIIDEAYNYLLFGSLDDKYKITYNSEKYRPSLIVFPEIGKIKDPSFKESLPEILYYIDFPIEVSNSYRRELSAHYSYSTEKTYDIDGYTLKVVKFRGKNRGYWCDKP